MKRARGKELVVVRELVLQAQRQRQHVARRGHLLVVRQARGVLEGRALHADLARLAGHQAGEVAFRAADVLGERDGDVVGGLGDQRLDRVDDGDLLAGFQPELGGGGGRRFLGHLDLGRVVEAPQLDQLERHVERHHLGERGGVALGVASPIVQHGTGVGVDGHCGIARGVRVSRCERARGQQGGEAPKPRGNGHNVSQRSAALTLSVHHSANSTAFGDGVARRKNAVAIKAWLVSRTKPSHARPRRQPSTVLGPLWGASPWAAAGCASDTLTRAPLRLS